MRGAETNSSAGDDGGLGDGCRGAAAGRSAVVEALELRWFRFILNAGQSDTNPKRKRGNFPRLRFGFVSVFAACSISFLIPHFALVAPRRVVILSPANSGPPGWRGVRSDLLFSEDRDP